MNDRAIEELLAKLDTAMRASGSVMAKDTGPQFRTGDVVKLRSGGPRMSVERAVDDKIHVVWFVLSCGLYGEFRRNAFAPELLVLVAAAGAELPQERKQ